MKDFFKNVAATIVGLFAFGLIMTILGFICIIGMVASSNSKPALKDNAVMVMKLQGQIEDRTEDNWLGELTGEQFKKGPKILIKHPRTYFCQWYFVSLDRDTHSFVMQEDEVDELAWVDIEQMKNELKTNPDKYVPAMDQIVSELGL